jgi:hypothetical protein
MVGRDDEDELITRDLVRDDCWMLSRAPSMKPSSVVSSSSARATLGIINRHPRFHGCCEKPPATSAKWRVEIAHGETAFTGCAYAVGGLIL